MRTSKIIPPLMQCTTALQCSNSQTLSKLKTLKHPPGKVLPQKQKKRPNSGQNLQCPTESQRMPPHLVELPRDAPSQFKLVHPTTGGVRLISFLIRHLASIILEEDRAATYECKKPEYNFYL